MARYDYKCPDCGLVFEVEHPMAERPRIVCPDCGTEASRVFEASGIVFKGSGFYNTDQRGSTKRSSATPATSAKETSETTKDTSSDSSTSKSTSKESSSSSGSSSDSSSTSSSSTKAK